MNGPHAHAMRGSPLLSGPGRLYCAWEFICSFLIQKKGYSEWNGFSTLYLHLLCLLVCRMKGDKGRGTGNAIKSLAFTRTVLRTKKRTRLGAAEVPADTLARAHKDAQARAHAPISTHLSSAQRSSALCFPSHCGCRFRGFIPVPSSELSVEVTIAIKRVREA